MNNFYGPEPTDEISLDYLHPDGKPLKDPVDDTEEAKPTWHNLRIAIDEADGHYMPRKDPYLSPEEQPDN
jgi:hypothetical protein